MVNIPTIELVMTGGCVFFFALLYPHQNHHDMTNHPESHHQIHITHQNHHDMTIESPKIRKTTFFFSIQQLHPRAQWKNIPAFQFHHPSQFEVRGAAQSSSSWLSVSRPMTMALATIKPEMKSCGQGARVVPRGWWMPVGPKKTWWETVGNQGKPCVFCSILCVVLDIRWMYLYLDRLPRA